MASVTSTDKRVAVVTGGNRGIGFEICRQLASNDIIVVLTAINEGNGVEAIEKLHASGVVNVVSHQVDVTDPISIAKLAKYVESKFQKLDILVNNAGQNGLIVRHDEFRAFKDGEGYMHVYDENAHLITELIEQPYDLGEECLKTNYYGTKAVTEAFLHLLQLSNSPRIVNVSSNYGELHYKGDAFFFSVTPYHYPTSYKPMEEKRYAVVTGGNKGIGFEVCRQLAVNGIEVILTARNKSRGLEAVEKLKASGFGNVVFHQLDTKDPTSIAELVAFIGTQYKKLDILGSD